MFLFRLLLEDDVAGENCDLCGWSRAIFRLQNLVFHSLLHMPGVGELVRYKVVQKHLFIFSKHLTKTYMTGWWGTA